MESGRNIKVILNEYKYIVGYSDIGFDLEKSIDIKIENDINLKDIFNYQVIRKKLVYNPIPILPFGVDLIYNGEHWIDRAPLEKQMKYYKSMIIEKTREIELLKISGFEDTQEEINLREQLKELKQLYMDKSHELALEINKVN